jgi:hypothetical protein
LKDENDPFPPTLRHFAENRRWSLHSNFQMYITGYWTTSKTLLECDFATRSRGKKSGRLVWSFRTVLATAYWESRLIADKKADLAPLKTGRC